MLELQQIQFAFDGNPVLSNVDLKMQAGELIAIVGPNGAGKSTLLRLIAGLIAPSQGTARVFATDPYHSKRQILAKRMAYLGQHYRMAFPFTALEVVLMGRYAHTRRGLLGRDGKSDTQLAMHALKRCHVDALAHRAIDELSGGEQRRVLIAQALCQESELLLLDEPTAGLDPKHAHDLFAMVRSECDDGRASLIVTHDLNLAARYAHKILLLHQGRRLLFDSPDNVLASKILRDAFSIQLHLGELPGGLGSYVVPHP